MSRKRDRSPSTVDSGDDEPGPSRSRKRLRLDPGLLLPPPAPFELSLDVSDDPGIELFIPNIPGEATQAEVTQVNCRDKPNLYYAAQLTPTNRLGPCSSPA